MDQSINSCINIIKSNNLTIDIYELKKFQDNSNYFYTYLFKNLSRNDLDKLLINFFGNCSFIPILYSFYSYLCYKASRDVSTILFEYLVDNNIDPLKLLEKINIDSNNIDQYRRIVSYLNKNILPYNIIFEKNNNLLYELKEKIQSEYSKNESNKFESLVIFPISREYGNEYLSYALKQLKINTNEIEIISNGIGNFSWCFRLNDNLVLKLSYCVVTWNIPMFYRINDFIVRKKFGKQVISISPYANINDVTNNDIYDALDDFDKAGLDLCDGNYSSNFGIVDYKMHDSMFRDVDGIIKYLNIVESESFKNRKVKLIDQDFIFFSNSEYKKYGVPIKLKNK